MTQRIRKAKISDAKEIYSLINSWSKEGKVLERSLNYIYENIRDFWVYEARNEIIGSCALHVVGWQDLGEIKSLVILKKFQDKGIGTKLVTRCATEAKSIGIKNVFALTFVPQFFKKLGFREIDRKNLPHKIWSDCVNCIYFPDCQEKAVILHLKSLHR
ncbi:MAG: N-acetyltransferase [Candidatus Omnitrophica bacterium]|jgi:amino-acid N-acetyltransferase|nr:N-acetyltransferase [Candidatus Omnitrophota bacterium]